MVGQYFRRALIACLLTLAAEITLAAFDTANVKTSADEVFIRKSTVIHFKVNLFEPDRAYENNAASLDSLVSWINRINGNENATLEKITVRSAASPEGGDSYNQSLAEKRARSISLFIIENTGVDRSLIIENPVGSDYEGLRNMVDTVSFQYRDEVIHILDNTPLYVYRNGKIVDSKKKQLMDLRGGRPWFWMLSNLYPSLRRTEVVINYAERIKRHSELKDTAKSISPTVIPTVIDTTSLAAEPAVRDKVKIVSPVIPTVADTTSATVEVTVSDIPSEIKEVIVRDTVVIRDTVIIRDTIVIRDTIRICDAIEPVPETVPDTLETIVQPIDTFAQQDLIKIFKARVAFSTNVLYDLAITPNFSMEIPIGRRWSTGFNYTFPWYVWDGNTRAYEILHLDIFARYWFNPSEALTGWFAGVNFGGGYFDIQPKGAGYQGEASVISIEAGYNWYINKHWRFTLSAAAGWMGAGYRRYDAIKSTYTHLVERYEGTYTWYGPTRLNVGFTYVFGRNVVKNK